MQVLALRMKNDATTTLLRVSSKKKRPLYTRTGNQHNSVLFVPLFPPLPPNHTSSKSLSLLCLNDKSQNTSTNSHDASTKLHSTTSSSSSLTTSASALSRSSSSRRISIRSRNIAIGSQQSTAALLGNALNGLEIGGRAITVLQQAGGSGGEEGFGAGGAEADGVGGGAA